MQSVIDNARYERRATTRHSAEMFHVSRTEKIQRRESVGYEGYAPAVYLWDDERDARDWLKFIDGGRLFKVSVDGMKLKWDAYGSFDKYGNAWRYEGDADMNALAEEIRPFPTEEELAGLYAAMDASDKQEAESFAAFEAHKQAGMHYTEVYQLPGMVEHHRRKKELSDELQGAFDALCQRVAPIKLPYPFGHKLASYRPLIQSERRGWERAQRAAPLKPEIESLKSILAVLPVKDRADLRTGNFAVAVTRSGGIKASIYEVTRETPKRRFAMARDLVNGQDAKLTGRCTEAIGGGYYQAATGYKIIDREVAHRLLAVHVAVNGPGSPA